MVLGKEKPVKGFVIVFWVLVAGAVFVELRDGALLWPVLLLFAWVVYWFSSNRGSQTMRAAEIPITHQPEVEPHMSAAKSFLNEESDSLVSVTLPGGEQSSGFRIKGGAGASRPSVRWVMPGESLDIGNITITGGFFYEGVTGRGSPESIDGCVVDPRAEVSRDWRGATSAPPSFRLSYQNLTAEQRRIYLEWLSSAREKSDINENYYRLYLYGFERRILIDAAVGKVSKEELCELVRELRRIVSFSDDYSWQLHVRGLCDYVGLLGSLPGRVYEQQAPESSGATYQVPLNVRVAFGQAAADKKPVPASWALAWAESDSMISRRTPVLRCPDEFRRAFLRKYTERFGAGMTITSNRTQLQARPSAMFMALSSAPVPGFLSGLPDISAVSGPRKKLQRLVDECADDLDAYSRYLGRNPEAKGRIDASLLLPADLWPDEAVNVVKELSREVEGGPLVTTFGKFLERLKASGDLSRDKVASLLSALEAAGIALEPDVRFGARTPKTEDAVALFATPPSTDIPKVSDSYVVGALMVDLAASIATADGEATDIEIDLISRELDAWSHLTAEERARLKAHNRVQLAQPPTMAGLKKRIEALTKEVRREIALFLVQTANADGVVSPGEVKLLEKIYRLLEIDSQQLYSDLHQNTRVEGQGGVGGRKPASPSTGNVSVGVALDAARIAALQKETARVSAMLADVFVEEQPAVQPPVVQPEVVEAEEREEGTRPVGNVIGLDEAHSMFLRTLVSRASWSRAELSSVALDLDLMLDGAIEQVNEAALDHWDESITDGDDPVEVNQELAQRLEA
ncbi:tellurite resistance TerB family protein [Burkholderia ambifaria]|uniref:tellurite resistance TerB family protein n=1 Tax=Burkholderia ambifaria TaxID=152480 RepID=UPI001C9357E0|nr:TerB N-terminal domain-containing protein [Burkholderia ambifaria]MBY4766727.1 TerB N-terminal domain-containing protein [Burkholderia ambifaria]